ncbi:hypothetical protein GY45DRAFT_1322075 [Cubamyces sp. BRFM 1775]|nr:hypothetical protein GY45DRAFT_1322075 [Cubamyces sp. BRFM 1775]
MQSNGHSAGVIESSHTYKLTHGRTRTVLDLSAKDWQSIKSAAWEASDYQKWVAEEAGSGGRWTFRNVATGLYLGVDGAPRPNALVIATRTETAWDIQPGREPSSVMLIAAGTRLCAQPGEGARVKLGEIGSGEWRVEHA